jgi:branched-chain amino acid transport system ATP-binding protein
MTVPAIVVDKLNVSYGSAQAIFDASYSLRAGSTTALLGRNGAGKTSLLKGTVGSPDVHVGGSVSLEGREVLGVPTHRLARAGVQLVPEDRRVFSSMTVADNLALASRLAGGRRGTLSHDDQVASALALFPTLTPLLTRMGDELSGGEQQLVAIARAVIADPTVILMDEPSEGLSPTIRSVVARAIEDIQSSSDVTVLLAEQNVAFALALSSWVIVIDNGRIVFDGSTQEFKSRQSELSGHLGV